MLDHLSESVRGYKTLHKGVSCRAIDAISNGADTPDQALPANRYVRQRRLLPASVFPPLRSRRAVLRGR